MTDPATTEAMVVRALTSWGEPQREIGAEIGTSGAWVSNVRRGQRHAKVRPDLPRWRSCEACHHWVVRCTLGFPEPELLDDLLRAGTECSAFVEARP
jgi:hypothetical protein